MKTHILPALRLTIFSVIFFCGIYPLLIWGIAQATPSKGKGDPFLVNGEVRGFALIGQKFTDDRYFQGRPSAVDYNPAGSGGSNKGCTNPEYLKTVSDRADSFLVHNPGIAKAEIPAELVTASGSGQDPDLTPAAALVQVKRIAAERGITEETIRELVQSKIKKPLLGLFGPARVNVLELNADLDQLQTKSK